MPLSIPVFVGSLFLLAVFFAVKEREVYRGRNTFATELLTRWSPGAEERWRRLSGSSQNAVSRTGKAIALGIHRAEEYVLWTGRFVVVLLAEKMIKAVKGEKLITTKGTASLYLKRMKEEAQMKEE